MCTADSGIQLFWFVIFRPRDNSGWLNLPSRLCTLTKIVRKSCEKYRKFSSIFSKWEYIWENLGQFSVFFFKFSYDFFCQCTSRWWCISSNESEMLPYFVNITQKRAKEISNRLWGLKFIFSSGFQSLI